MESSCLARCILRFTERLQREDVNMHGFLLSVSGREIAKAYWFPFREGLPHRLYSVSKTFTGIAVGMLAEDGLLSLDHPVADFFRDWLPEKPSPFLLRLTIRDMLRMATCYRRTAYREGVDENWALSFFTGTPDHEPGMVFAYDTGCSQVLAALVKRVSGQEVISFLENRLFRPLGCLDPRQWLRDPSGCCQGGTGLCMSLRDMHRVSECLLRGGDGLVPGWYVREMGKKQIGTSLQENEEERYGYGWQCWRTRAGWALYGMGGQLSVLCPDRQAVLSTIADTRLDPVGVQRIYDAFFEEVWPYLPEDGRIPEDEAGLPLELDLPAAGLADDEAVSPSGEGCYIFCEPNPLGLKSLTLTRRELVLVRNSGSAVLSFARGKTLETSWPGAPEVPATVSAAWVDTGNLRLRCHAVGNAPCGFDMLLSLRDGFVTVRSRCSSDPLTAGYDGIASGTLQKGVPYR